MQVTCFCISNRGRDTEITPVKKRLNLVIGYPDFHERASHAGKSKGPTREEGARETVAPLKTGESASRLLIESQTMNIGAILR